MAGVNSLVKPALQKYVIDSNKAVEFKLVRSSSDLEDDSTTFHPEMSHQIYGEREQIFGYIDLRVKLYYTAGRLTTYLSYTYREKVNPNKCDGIEADEVIKPIVERLEPGYLTNLEDFIIAVEKDASFRPCGEMVNRFSVEADGKERTFELFFSNTLTPGFKEYHGRMQPFILWYIDAASYIDTDDDKWRFFTIFEKYHISGNTQYGLVGFTTVYEYYAYPSNIRPRISQMLILPPFQCLGIGAKLLNVICAHYWSDKNVIDLTVEDPSENFIRLRDYVDGRNCTQLSSFTEGKLLDNLSEDMIREATEKFKLNKKQIRRVYEILRLRVTDRTNEEEYRLYRLYVKNRLFNLLFRKEDNDLKKLKKFLAPEEFAATMTVTSKDRRMEVLEKMYRETEEDYDRVIERLNNTNDLPS